MRRLPTLLGALAAMVVVSASALAQDILAEHKRTGLKGLSSVEIVWRLPESNDQDAIATWSKALRIGLRSRVPGLDAKEDSQELDDWLEVHIVQTPLGAFLELNVYRRVMQVDSSTTFLTKIWWDQRFIFGSGVQQSQVVDSLNTLVTSFAADYHLANR